MFDSNTNAPTGVNDHDCPETTTWFFDPLPVGNYDLVVIDPPWPFQTWSPLGQGKSPSKHYRTMPLNEIMALPIRKLLKDNAIVYLWATGPLLDGAVATLKAWG